MRLAATMTDTPDLGGKLGPFLAMMAVAGAAMIGSGIYLLPASLVAIATATYAAPRARGARRMAGGAASPTA